MEGTEDDPKPGAATIPEATTHISVIVTASLENERLPSME